MPHDKRKIYFCVGFSKIWKKPIHAIIKRLRDQMGRKFMVAHVFKFRFATTDVTALDGAYEIKGIPVGKVNVSAMLPAAKLLSTTQKDVVIKEGNNRLDLVLEFDKEKHVPNPIE